jgi:tyrosine-protein phosphatase YwqE
MQGKSFFGRLMIDFPCHFLPGIDDGAQTVEEIFPLAPVAAANCIRHVVLMPYIHAGVFPRLLPKCDE